MRSTNVGELPGILASVVPPSFVGAVEAAVGSGLTCSAVTSKRSLEVPKGVQVIRVRIGLSVG